MSTSLDRRAQTPKPIGLDDRAVTSQDPGTAPLPAPPPAAPIDPATGYPERYEPGLTGLVQAISVAFRKSWRTRFFSRDKNRNMYTRALNASVIDPSVEIIHSIRSVQRHFAVNRPYSETPFDPLAGLPDEIIPRLLGNAVRSWWIYVVLTLGGLLLLPLSATSPNYITIQAGISGLCIAFVGASLALRVARDFHGMWARRTITARDQLKHLSEYWAPWPLGHPIKRRVGIFLAGATVLVLSVAILL